MALPLIMLGGVGLLGGAQYLLKQADKREAQSSFADLQSNLANSSLPMQEQNQILARAQNAIDNDSFWNRSSVSSQIDDYSDYALTRNSAYNNLAAQQQLQAQQMYATSDRAALDRVWDEAKEADTRYGFQQDQWRTVQSLYNEGNTSALDLNGMVNSIAKMQFPDEALNEGDVLRVFAATPLGSQIMNRIDSALKGKADPTLAADLVEFARSLMVGAQTNWNQANTNKDALVDEYRKQGYLQSNLPGMRFGTVDPNMEFPAPAPPGISAPAQTTSEALQSWGSDIKEGARATFQDLESALDFYTKRGWIVE